MLTKVCEGSCRQANSVYSKHAWLKAETSRLLFSTRKIMEMASLKLYYLASLKLCILFGFPQVTLTSSCPLYLGCLLSCAYFVLMY